MRTIIWFGRYIPVSLMIASLLGGANHAQPIPLALGAAPTSTGQQKPSENTQKHRHHPRPKAPHPRPPAQIVPPAGNEKIIGSGDPLPVANNGASAVFSTGTGAAAMGAAAGGVMPGANVPSGAIVGAPVGGLAGAVWADRNNDGVVDGFVFNGQYYPGAPPGYLPTTGALLTHSDDLEIPPDAVAGAPVKDFPGAVWAAPNDDGVVHGYVYEGQYFSGAPKLRRRSRPGERG